MERKWTRPRHSWTDDDDKQLLTSIDAGTPRESIAARLGVTSTAVRKRMHVLRPPLPMTSIERRFTTTEQAELLRLESEGMSQAAIARTMGKKRYWVNRRLAQLRPRPSHIADYRPPPELIIDRDKRQIAVRDITGTLMGDPMPGYSALDRRDADEIKASYRQPGQSTADCITKN
jgi:biotin operon repressor